MHSTILGCASDGFHKSFKNLKKCVILRMRKKSTISKNACVWCFSKSARPDCKDMHFKLIKNALKIIFSPKQSIFTFLTQKLWSEKQLSQNTSILLPVKMHILMHKFILILLALGQKK